MKKITLVAVGLLVFVARFSTAQELYRPIAVSIKSEIDIPLPPDPNLFQLGGGTAVSASYVFPFFRPLSAGILVNYHLGRLHHEDLGIRGSLSLISAEAFRQFMVYAKKASAPEYTKADVKKWMNGDRLATETVTPQIVASGYNLFTDLPEIEIPVYFFVGRYDYQTPGSLTEEYYNAVKAPAKELIWFEESAHFAIQIETDKMTRELIRISRETMNE